MAEAMRLAPFLRENMRTAHQISCLTALAELIHNAADAHARRVDIRVEEADFKLGEDHDAHSTPWLQLMRGKPVLPGKPVLEIGAASQR
jgi:hypothetical protein